MAFTDRDGHPVDAGDPPTGGSLYAEIGAFQGRQYHRNAFAQGTQQEADVLAEVLALPVGACVLDVGCGNGRHVQALRTRGIAAVGLDLSPEVLAGGVGVAGRPAVAAGRGIGGSAGDRMPLVAGRSQHLPFADGSVDGVISVCQGGFGITAAQDDQAVGEWYRVLRTGGRVAFTAFSLVFASRYLAAGEGLDVERGLHHHRADVRGADDERRTFDLWTAAYSVPHLHQLLAHHGFDVLGTAGVEPGSYRMTPAPTVADPEILIWAIRR